MHSWFRSSARGTNPEVRVASQAGRSATLHNKPKARAALREPSLAIWRFAAGGGTGQCELASWWPPDTALDKQLAHGPHPDLLLTLSACCAWG